MAITVKKVIAYVDGFNLYFGLRDSNLKRLYWLNIKAMVQNLLKGNQQLIATKYFTARISGPPEKRIRQNTFLEALGTLSEIYYGHYLSKKITCRNCKQSWPSFEEKMTDVNIATEMLVDAFEDRFDTALLISADSDLVGPVNAIRKMVPQKKVIVFFPPKRSSAALKAVADVQLSLGHGLLAQNQFPDKVVRADGYVLQRPSEWR
ncbi:MAG: NYN domain-containing protein [Sedimentisphaerales bacterium]